MAQVIGSDLLDVLYPYQVHTKEAGTPLHMGDSIDAITAGTSSQLYPHPSF